MKTAICIECGSRHSNNSVLKNHKWYLSNKCNQCEHLLKFFENCVKGINTYVSPNPKIKKRTLVIEKYKIVLEDKK